MLDQIENIKLRHAVDRVFETYRDSGYACYIAGGFVRDSLLGQNSFHDIDFACSAPIEVTKTLFERVVETGASYGTVTLIVDGFSFEVTRFRTDHECDGRHASVRFAETIEDDLSRRDLTVNSLAMRQDGTIIDLFGGIDDLKEGRVRFVGDAATRAREDYLRILRFIRFSGRFGKTAKLDPETVAVIMQDSIRGGLDNISRERVWAEMAKVVTGRHGVEMLSSVIWTGIYKHIDLPFTDNSYFERVHRANENHCQPATIMAAYIGNNPDAFNRLADAWKFSVEERRLGTFISTHIGTGISLRDAQWMHAVKNVPIFHLLELFRAEGWLDLVRDLQSWTVPIFPVTGDDLLAIGFKTGPWLGAKLKGLLVMWVDGGFIETKEQLLRKLQTS